MLNVRMILTLLFTVYWCRQWAGMLISFTLVFYCSYAVADMSLLYAMLNLVPKNLQVQTLFLTTFTVFRLSLFSITFWQTFSAFDLECFYLTDHNCWYVSKADTLTRQESHQYLQDDKLHRRERSALYFLVVSRCWSSMSVARWS